MKTKLSYLGIVLTSLMGIFPINPSEATVFLRTFTETTTSLVAEYTWTSGGGRIPTSDRFGNRIENWVINGEIVLQSPSATPPGYSLSIAELNHSVAPHEGEKTFPGKGIFSFNLPDERDKTEKATDKVNHKKTDGTDGPHLDIYEVSIDRNRLGGINDGGGLIIKASHVVPEPTTILASMTILGFGLFLKKKS